MLAVKRQADRRRMPRDERRVRFQPVGLEFFETERWQPMKAEQHPDHGTTLSRL
jgi:hypothetical protein